MKETIKLAECPELLQEKVATFLKRYPESQLLAAQKLELTPYKDNSIINTSYKAFTMHGNYFCVYKMTICSRPEWSDTAVRESCMIAGEIAEIVRLSPEWFN